MKLRSRIALSLSVVSLVSLAACGGGHEPRQGFVMGKSIFSGSAGTKAATMELVFPPEEEGQPWTSVIVQESDEMELVDVEGSDKKKEVFPEGGNVFHKCMWFDPAYGEPGILSISANAPFMKIWRKQGDTWTAETLWTGVVGGKENRLRDVEVGDVDGDGQDELVVVTHDLGVTLVFEQTPEGMVPTEVSRTDERIFIHEVEIGDVDGDGVAEFMTTPSEPNKFDGEHQAGSIHLFQHEDGKYVQSTVEDFTTRHAKEILVTDIDGDGTPELYSALEGTVGEGMAGGGDDTTKIRRWTWQDGKMVGEDLVTLPGHLCRFLNAGDTNGDGVTEIVASTRSEGIFSIWQEEGSWQHKVIVPAYLSGGFEHTTYLLDWDGDGADDLFVASDDQKSLQRFTYSADYQTYEPEELKSYKGTSYITWNMMPLPAGL